MPTSASLLESLQQAKVFFLKEYFTVSQHGFEEVVKYSFPSFPDIWIDATYGLAECERLKRSFPKACSYYQRCLDYGVEMDFGHSRFSHSNRLSVLESFCALIEIGRLSLRVDVDAIAALIDAGYEWASKELGQLAARQKFTYARTLLQNNIVGPGKNTQPLKGLLREINDLPVHLTVLNRDVVQLKLLEYYLGANHPADAGDLLKHPEASRYQAPVYQWSRTKSVLLEGKWKMLQGEYEAATDILQQFSPNHPNFKLYPELLIQHAGLSFEAIHMQGNIEGEGLNSYIKQIREGIKEAYIELGDLSTPLWHLVHLVRLLFRNGFKDNSLHSWKDTIGEVTSLFKKLLETDWLTDVLVSRSVPADLIGLLAAFFSSEEQWEHCNTEVSTALDRLSLAVCP